MAVTVFGEEYKSFAALGKAYGISGGTLKGRVNAGRSPEEAVTDEILGCGKSDGYEIAGKRFENLKECADYYGVHYGTALSRLRRGLSAEDAILRPILDGKIPVWCDGREFPTIASAARFHKVNVSTVRSRLNWGWSIREALTRPVRELAAPLKPKPHSHSVSVTIEGVRYPSLRAAAKGSGVSDNTLNALYKKGKDVGLEAERILERRRKKEARVPRRFIVDGVVYPDVDKMCKAYDISFGTFITRIRDGMTTDEAVKVPTLPYQRYSFVFNGKTYFSIQQLADDYELTHSVLSRRLEKNGGDIAKSVKKGRQVYGEPVTAFGVTYDNLRFASEAYGLPVNMVYSRIHSQGMTLEDALTAPRKHS